MIVPKPGPTLHTAVAAPLNAVVQSSPIRESPRAITAIVIVKKNEKVKSDRMISSSTGWPLYFFESLHEGGSTASGYSLIEHQQPGNGKF